MRLLTTSLVLTALLALALFFGVGPAIGVGAWIWMSVGVRQALSGSGTEEYDNALVLREGDFL